MSLGAYFETFGDLLRKVDPREVQPLEDALVDAWRNGRLVFLIGNGGSGANASHIAQDLGKGTVSDFEKQRRLKVMSLADNTPGILAWANDTSYERIFVEQLKNFAEPGAVLVAMSGSGNSPNVLRAVEYANGRGMTTFGLTGYDGGKLRKLARHSIHVASFNMGVVECVHILIFHYLMDALHERFKSPP
jgi:D-sedoheptulose 7-phosphate isomerase